MAPFPELRRLENRLLDYRGPEDDPSPPGGGFSASVALVLRPAGDSPELLLIRRAESERDPWSGHMAFPGGRRHPGDRSLLDTALRETHEETGIMLMEAGEALGRLGEVAPLSTHLPALSILPFVFAVPRGTPARPASLEVAEVLWVPLAHFRIPGARTIHRFPLGDEHLSFPAFEVEGKLVWGLTQRILDDLLSRLT